MNPDPNPTGTYTFALADSDEAFHALEPEWSALHARSRPRNPFLSFPWSRACREHLCPRAELYLLTARRDARLAGIAPLRVDRQLGFRVLRFLGDGRSDYLGFIRDPEEPDVEGALLAHMGADCGKWDLMVLRQLCATYTGLDQAALPPGVLSAGVEGTIAPYLEFPGDWAALEKEGPEQLRHSRRPARKLLKEGGAVERLTGAEAAARVEEISGVEARSWKAQRGTARFQPGPGQRLLREAFSRFPEGEMELWIARLDGQAIAFLINFVTPERICYYQGAYDEAFRRFYAGGVLHRHAMERAWQAGLREYDFMSGDEGYKSGWTNAVRSIRYRALYPDTLRGRAAFAALIAPRWHLKSSPRAHTALQWWVQVRNNPLGLLRGS